MVKLETKRNLWPQHEHCKFKMHARREIIWEIWNKMKQKYMWNEKGREKNRENRNDRILTRPKGKTKAQVTKSRARRHKWAENSVKAHREKHMHDRKARIFPRLQDGLKHKIEAHKIQQRETWGYEFSASTYLEVNWEVEILIEMLIMLAVVII